MNTAIPPEQMANTIEKLMNHRRGWDFIKLSRGDQELGGMIVIRDVNTFEKVVALIDSYAQPVREEAR